MQANFKSRQAYLEWRAHWRRSVKDVSSVIRTHKDEARKPTNNSERQREAQSNLRSSQMLARCLYMALETAKEEYTISKMIDKLAEMTEEDFMGAEQI